MSGESESEPAADGLGSIRARFVVTKSNVSILADYRGISMNIAWKRLGDPDADARHLRTLISNLPELVKDGLREVYVSDQAKRIDYELAELFKDEDEKHGSSTEEPGSGLLDPEQDPDGA